QGLELLRAEPLQARLVADQEEHDRGEPAVLRQSARQQARPAQRQADAARGPQARRSRAGRRYLACHEHHVLLCRGRDDPRPVRDKAGGETLRLPAVLAVGRSVRRQAALSGRCDGLPCLRGGSSESRESTKSTDKNDRIISKRRLKTASERRQVSVYRALKLPH